MGEDAPWASVDVAAGVLDDPHHLLPAGLLGPQCAACRVNSLRTEVPYEARVTYYAACGCRSQASASSVPTFINVAAVQNSPLAETPPPAQTPLFTSPTGASVDALQFQAPPPPTMTPPPNPAGQHGEAGQRGATPDGSHHMPAMQDFASVSMSQGMPLEAAPLMLGAIGEPSGPPPTAGWRCIHGGLIPPAAPPELIPLEEAGRSILIQWPTVVHAVAYTVELFEEGSGALERFRRSVPENLQEALVELRVGNLQVGSYGACVRCIAPCGCEATPSAWSFLPPAWPPAPPHMAGAWPSVGPPPVAPPSQPYLPSPSGLLSTNPGSPSLPPPPPSEPPTVQGGGSNAPTSAPPAAPATSSSPSGAAGEEALVLD